jgi:hypothetical protein
VSGGHFGDYGYDYYKVAQFADELEVEIGNNGKEGNAEDGYSWYPDHEPEVIEYLKQQLPKLRKIAEIMRIVDYLYSGDIGDDNFFERIKEIEEKYKDT